MDLFEILLPVLVIIIYFLTTLFKGGEKDEDATAPGPPPLSKEEQDIQEEIRRKIQERTREQPSSQEGSDRSVAQEVYDPTRPEKGQRRVQGQIKKSQEDTRPFANDERRRQEGAPPPLEPALSRHSSSMEDRMRKQQEEIDAMELRAEQVRSQAQQRLQDLTTRGKVSDPYTKSRSSPYQIRGRRQGDLSSEVIASLKNPQEFKKAFLAYEILGTPVGQRRGSQMGPLWDQ